MSYCKEPSLYSIILQLTLGTIWSLFIWGNSMSQSQKSENNWLAWIVSNYDISLYCLV